MFTDGYLLAFSFAMAVSGFACGVRWWGWAGVILFALSLAVTFWDDGDDDR